MKGSGKPDDRKGQVRFEVAGAGDGFTVRLVRHRQTKETEQIGFTYEIPRQSSTLLVLGILRIKVTTLEARSRIDANQLTHS